MNKLDERIYKALKFFADNSRAEVTVLFQNNKPQYSQIVPEDIEKSLSESDYISPQAKTRYMITNEGLVELRKLEEIKNRDKQLWYKGTALIISFIALLFSLISLIKSIGWI